jgi:hypothetical protein
MYLACQNAGKVAQVFNLLYRRFVIGRRPTSRVPVVMAARFPFLAPAECNSAIQQIENLRYSSGVPVR